MHLINLIGGSGSGKGYLAEKIIETFGADRVDTIPYDMYYYPDAVFPQLISMWILKARNLRILTRQKRSRQISSIQHIEQLKNGQEVQIPDYDFGNNPTGKSQRKPGRIIQPKDFIILDGLFWSLWSAATCRKLTDVEYIYRALLRSIAWLVVWSAIGVVGKRALIWVSLAWQMISSFISHLYKRDIPNTSRVSKPLCWSGRGQ
jgi:hypothetical protein